MTYPGKADRRQINIELTPKMHDGLRRAAAVRNMTPTSYARLLLEAAYSASVKETGDFGLDATVSATLILYGNGMNIEAMAKALKCKEHTIETIIHTFQSEMRSTL